MTALLIVMQFYSGLALAMNNASTMVMATQDAHEHLLPEDASACPHHAKMNHSTGEQSSASKGMNSNHDCCDTNQVSAVSSVHNLAKASQSSAGCASCGDDCVCGINCHMLSNTVLEVGSQELQVLTQVQSAVDNFTAQIISVYPSLEEIPPKL